MKNILIATAMGLSLISAAAQTADNLRQTNRSQCNQAAGDKRGEERKEFMRTCLADARKQRQERTAHCVREAKTRALKGGDRRKFVSECVNES